MSFAIVTDDLFDGFAWTGPATLDVTDGRIAGVLPGADRPGDRVAVRPRSQLELDRVVEHFGRRCREVVRVPWDPHLETGAESALEQLRRAQPEREPSVRDGPGRDGRASRQGSLA